jgi:FkbH-like protein
MSHTTEDASVDRTHKDLANILRKGRAELGQALIKSSRDNRFNEPPEVFTARALESVDLLVGHIEGKQHFDALYSGQRAMELIRPEQDRNENLKDCRKSVDCDLSVYLDFLRPKVTSAQAAEFKRLYISATAGLTTEAARHVRTLFVGDCIMAEIATFLGGPLASIGISIDPFPINPRSVEELKRLIAGLPSKQFDLIFFSPFSHSRIPEIETFISPRRGLVSSAENLEAHAVSIIDQTRPLLDHLASSFECPIYINNGAFVHKSVSAAKSLLSAIAIRRSSSFARRRINGWLADYIANLNDRTFPHLFLIDEDAIASHAGRVAVSRYLHSSPFQHAAVISQKIASAYQDRIQMAAQLLGKKLVICDLDNTIWDGLIGEGSVSHFVERQSVLRSLKEFGGIVLSIASKNDPANVNFVGGVLSEADFVAPQISWGMKTEAIARIKRTLNLQTKHMVFVDDRPDERALVVEAFPDITVLDACDPQAWERLRLWSEVIHGSSDVDRTKLYKEQESRDAAVEIQAEASVSDQLKKLGFTVTVSPAQKRELKRVAELINRTNQWNLCGTKTSFEQVRAWHSSPDHCVLVASASDKFGDMGTVCVAVTKTGNGQVDIPVFVLSCRVFGYGVETAVLGEIQRLAAGFTLRGAFRSTTQNHLCGSMYRDHGFELGPDNSFVSGSAPIPVPGWVELRRLDAAE